MKKHLLSFLFLSAAVLSLQAQTVLHDNGPLVNYPGQGSGGADVSALETGIHNYGYNINKGSGFRMAEDFTVPGGQSWSVDSFAFFAYQTGSTTSSTFSEVNFVIWNGSPDDPNSNVIYGDSTLNSLETTTWTGIYRTNATFTNTQRPVMRNVVTSPGLVLSSGTYWIEWRASGSLQSGPWNPPITINGQLNTGNALQYSPTAAAWQPVWGDTLNTYPQGMPFQVIGSIINSISNTYLNNSVKVQPNPFTSETFFNIDTGLLTGEKLILNVFDVTGRKVESKEVNTTTFRFGRGNLNAGVYNYIISNSSGNVAIGKMVIQ